MIVPFYKVSGLPWPFIADFTLERVVSSSRQLVAKLYWYSAY